MGSEQHERLKIVPPDSSDVDCDEMRRRITELEQELGRQGKEQDRQGKEQAKDWRHTNLVLLIVAVACLTMGFLLAMWVVNQ